MRLLTPSLGIAFVSLALVASAAPDPPPDPAADPNDAVIRVSRGGRVHIRAPGVRIDVDAEKQEGIVDIETNDARVYADHTGKVDIRAAGVRIRVDSVRGP